MASRFFTAGWHVAAVDVDESGLATLAAELPGVWTGVLDVRSVSQWDAVLADFTATTHGRLDVLVNNAGLLTSGPFVDLDPAAHQRIVEVNVGGVVNGCHRAFTHLRAAADAGGRPRVVNLCSSSAIYGQPELAVYSATKFAVRGLTEALDLEWAEAGVTVRAVWPLFVRTAMTEDMDIATVRRMGVHLTAQDVAEVVFDTATSRRAGPVHRGVGRESQLMLAGSALSPSWLTRLVNKRLAR